MNANATAGPYVDALVFDAYGTLFDVQSVEATAGRLFPGHGAALSQLWRTKQLEYTWLQSLMLSVHQRREDFAAITAHALDYAVEKLGLDAAHCSGHQPTPFGVPTDGHPPPSAQQSLTNWRSACRWPRSPLAVADPELVPSSPRATVPATRQLTRRRRLTFSAAGKPA